MFSKLLSPAKERILFGFFLILHLIPILYFTPFVTLDGPAHLYNAHLVQQLFSTPGTVISHFFQINKFPEPNWTGHAVVAFITLLIPPLIAEKIWLVFIILTSALGFRKLVAVLDASTQWMSWLYFPFIYNFTFCLGFFNFAFALGLLPWVLVWWLRFRFIKLTLPVYIAGLSIATVLYFSHLVIFLLAGLFCGIISLCDWRRSGYKTVFNSLFKIALFAFPWLVLSFLFVWTGGTAGYRGEITYLKSAELTEWISNARMFVVYNYDAEKGFTQLFVLLIAALTIAGIVKWKKNSFQLPFLIILFCSLLLIYFLPDSMASGGILSVRIVQLFYLCWCIWIVTLRISEKWQPAFSFLTVIFSCVIIYNHVPVWNGLSKEADNYVQAAKVIQPGSVVLPLNYSQNWLHSNMCGYMGALNQLVILDNYEATTKHFPVLWKKGMFPETVLGTYSSSNNPCIHIREFEKTFALKIDYVVALIKPEQGNDSCKSGVEEQLSSMYVPLPDWKNNDVQIFKRKK